MRNIRDDILSDLLERGLSEQDIDTLDADVLFEEYCNWHGLLGWGSTLVAVLDHLRDAVRASQGDQED